MIKITPFVYHTVLNGDHTHQIVDGLIPSDLTENQTLWQHLDLNESAALNWLNGESGLEPVILDALCAEETRPRSFKAKNGLLVVLRGVNTNPGHDPEDMVSVRMWIEKDRILTVRRRTIMSIQDIMHDLDNGHRDLLEVKFPGSLQKNHFIVKRKRLKKFQAGGLIRKMMDLNAVLQF